MYSIFHALDPNERLPRELLREGSRYRQLEWRHVISIVGTLYLPVLILMVVVLGALNVNPLFAFAIAGAVLIGVYVFVLATRRP